jgi:hypothetical protein
MKGMGSNFWGECMTVVDGESQRMPIGGSIAAGFAAPWRHFRGFVVSSALWLVAVFLLQLEVSQNREWITQDDGDVVWRYTLSAQGFAIFVAQFLALVSFFVTWSRGLYFQRADEFRWLRLDRRLWWLVREALKLGVVIVIALIVLAFAAWLFGLFNIGEVLRVIFSLLLLAFVVASCCRFATIFTAVAVDDEPRDFVDSIDHTKGSVIRILIAFLPIYVLKKLIDLLFFGIGSSWAVGTSIKLRTSSGPIFGTFGPDRVEPIWAVAASTLTEWFYLGMLFATMVYVYRQLQPAQAKDAGTLDLF